MSTASASDTVVSTATIATTAAVVTASVLILAREVLWPRWAGVLRSPLKTTLPRLSKEETRQLVYQPDQFPGARDVESPVRWLQSKTYWSKTNHCNSMVPLEYTNLAQRTVKRSSLSTASLHHALLFSILRKLL